MVIETDDRLALQVPQDAGHLFILIESERHSIAFRLWDVATIAQFLKRSDAQVRERIICLPDFPKAIRLPSQSGGRAHPLYKAAEVVAWAEKYRERKTGT